MIISQLFMRKSHVVQNILQSASFNSAQQTRISVN